MSLSFDEMKFTVLIAFCRDLVLTNFKLHNVILIHRQEQCLGAPCP